MPHAPKQLVLLLVACWAVPGALAGCASGRRVPQAQAPIAASPALLIVTNDHWSDVRVYLVRGSLRLRLGTVPTGTAASFEIPPDFIGRGSDVYLVASPLAARTAYTSSLFAIAPGDVVELTVENQLQFSRLVVR